MRRIKIVKSGKLMLERKNSAMADDSCHMTEFLCLTGFALRQT